MTRSGTTAVSLLALPLCNTQYTLAELTQLRDRELKNRSKILGAREQHVTGLFIPEP
jgi:hypothetical protein